MARENISLTDTPFLFPLDKMLTLLRTCYLKKEDKKNYPAEMGPLSARKARCPLHFQGVCERHAFPHSGSPHDSGRSDRIAPTENPGSAVLRILLRIR